MKKELIKLLIAGGMPAKLAATLSGFVTVETTTDVETTATALLTDYNPPEQPQTEQELNTLAEQAAADAVAEYEQQYNLQNGVPRTTPTPEPQTPENVMVPEMVAMQAMVAELTKTVSALAAQTQQQQRSAVVSEALTAAQIPEKAQHFYNDKALTGEELATDIATFAAELKAAGLADQPQPQSHGIAINMETAALSAAEKRNTNAQNTSGISGIQL